MYNEDYLAHYGVKGMRWGIRRAYKKASNAKTSEARDKAVNNLYKHRGKAINKINKLEVKRSKLDKALVKSTKTDATKSAQLEAKASKMDAKIAKNQRKASRFYTRNSKAQKLLAKNQVLKMKSDILHAKASTFKANYEKNKAKVEANDIMVKGFQQGVKDVDNMLVQLGRKYVNG